MEKLLTKPNIATKVHISPHPSAPDRLHVFAFQLLASEETFSALSFLCCQRLRIGNGAPSDSLKVRTADLIEKGHSAGVREGVKRPAVLNETAYKALPCHSVCWQQLWIVLENLFWRAQFGGKRLTAVATSITPAVAAQRWRRVQSSRVKTGNIKGEAAEKEGRLTAVGRRYLLSESHGEVPLPNPASCISWTSLIFMPSSLTSHVERLDRRAV